MWLRKGRILHPLPGKVSLQGATSQPDKTFCKDRVIKKDQDEGLECLCALDAGCFLHCGSAIKPLLLCGCSQTSPLHPCTASTRDFHEKKSGRLNSLPPSGHFQF